MKKLTNYITETKTQLSVADKLLCTYFIQGLKETRNKVQIIEDLDLLFRENKEFKKLVFKFIKGIDIPGVLQVKYIDGFEETGTTFYNYIEGININDLMKYASSK